jgi:hypothetical protein
MSEPRTVTRLCRCAFWRRRISAVSWCGGFSRAMWLAELASQDCRCWTVDWLAERIAAPALTGAGAGATAATNAVLAAAWSVWGSGITARVRHPPRPSRSWRRR